MSQEIVFGKGKDEGEGGESWKWAQPHPQRMADLQNTGFGSDLTIILGPEQSKVRVHKIFLQAGSRVLNSSIKKCSGTQLVIENVDARIFGLMLKYLYTGDSGASMGDALPLLQLATDFEVDELRDQCATLLRNDLTLENVLPLFQGAIEYAHKQLIQNTLEYICRQGSLILKREEFSNLRLQCLIEIIQQDELHVKDEMEVFQAVYRWGEAECVRKAVDGSNVSELRKVLDKPLKHIRFPLMDKEEFALNVGTKNILDMSELTTLLMCFLVSPERRNVLPVGRFSSTLRTSIGVPIVYSRLPRGAIAYGAPELMITPTEIIMIRSRDECASVGLISLTMSTKIFNVKMHDWCSTYNGNGSIFANLTITSGQQTLLEVKKQALKENGDVLELELENVFTLPGNKDWVVLCLTVFGTVRTESFGRAQKSIQRNGLDFQGLSLCSSVANYEDFQQQSDTVVNHLGVEFKRNEGNATPMNQGLIETITFATV